MLLQPLLENAFKHGVERSREPVAIRIDAKRRDDELHVTIRNTGSMLAATPGKPGSACATAASAWSSSTATAREPRARAGWRWRRRAAHRFPTQASRMIRVLIVDDEAPARDKLRRWLDRAAGHRRSSASAADGLAAAAAIAESAARRGVPRHPDAGAERPGSGGATRAGRARRCSCSSPPTTSTRSRRST